MCCLAPPSGKSLARTKKGWRMGRDYNPGAEAENQEGPANSPSNDPLPLQHCQGAIGCLCLRWLLGGSLFGIEPYSISN